TIAGTGEQSHDYFKTGPALTVGLNSPWDLQLVGRSLYIAMAGPHQLWKLDLDKKEVSTFAGSGREARSDGSLLQAGFAQPSGLAASGKTLFVADSEANIIRAVDLQSGQVKTVVGGDLFEFGDIDGEGDDVRLQHPLGLFPLGDRILIADTYNHKIKELDPKQRRVKSLFGSGKPGQADGVAASFYEPGGLSVANGKLYVADTNNHAIRVVDLKTKEVATLRIKGLEPPTVAVGSPLDVAPNAVQINLQRQRLRATGEGTIIVDVNLPTGYHLNPAAPQRFKVSVENGLEHVAFRSNGQANEKSLSQTSKDLRLPLRVPVQALSPGNSEVRIQLTLFYCREDNTGTCQIKTLVWNAPVEVVSDATAANEIKVEARLSGD
ncbi:MAG TPA: hypothetical protein VIV66_18340, partial [Pyrinomonadaceae bacterium]